MGVPTYQDFLEERDVIGFIQRAITNHRSSEVFRVACDADQYDCQRNVTIENYVQTIMSLAGEPIVDFTASNNRIPSNFFNRLNTQRCMYSLGNGVTFANDEGTKDKLGPYFDRDIKEAAYYALIHGVSFCFWNYDRLNVFKITDFVPLWDEYDGTLRAGIYFYRQDYNKPLNVTIFTEDGYTKYREGREDKTLREYEPMRAYVERVAYTPAGGYEVVGGERYSSLPVVPMWGSRLKQSTLIGMRSAIDSFDLIRSGFANDLTDVSQVYWLIENCGGMDDSDLARFRDRLKLTHIASVDTDSDSKVSPYTQEIPHEARKQYLDDIRAGIYEDFGGLDVHTIAAGATNDHIDAAYQPLDENADDFEYQVSDCIMQILELMGIEDVPTFKRNRISNQLEQVEMVAQEAQWLDQATILAKLPNITPDEAAAILDGQASEDFGRMAGGFVDAEEGVTVD